MTETFEAKHYLSLPSHHHVYTLKTLEHLLLSTHLFVRVDVKAMSHIVVGLIRCHHQRKKKINKHVRHYKNINVNKFLFYKIDDQCTARFGCLKNSMYSNQHHHLVYEMHSCFQMLRCSPHFSNN